MPNICGPLKERPPEFKVNQQIGSGTWVYLGTFTFDKGRNDYGMVVLSNESKKRKAWSVPMPSALEGAWATLVRGDKNQRLAQIPGRRTPFGLPNGRYSIPVYGG